ncbi:GDSL-type esterase/lipase family protein, partial [Bradyrhizobium sp. 38]
PSFRRPDSNFNRRKSAGAGQAANGLARLDRAVPDGTHAVIVQLGGTDMLRGTDPNVTRAALAAILQNLQARRIVALLCGARPHTNFGHEYEKAFAAMFAGLASEYNVLFYEAFDDVLSTILSSRLSAACIQIRLGSKRSSRAYCPRSRLS